MAKYNAIVIFTKNGSLAKFANHAPDVKLTHDVEYYNKEREIQLALSLRTERTVNGTKCYCKISCPVNPLPVKGEFEVPSFGVIYEWLYQQGWTRKEIINKRWFE